jgi:hypothetical protein
MAIFLGVDYRTLPDRDLVRLANSGDKYAGKFLAARAKTAEPVHTPGRSERDADHNRVARQGRVWRDADTREAQQRAKILENLGLTPKKETRYSRPPALASAAGNEKILHALQPAKSWRGPLFD